MKKAIFTSSLFVLLFVLAVACADKKQSDADVVKNAEQVEKAGQATTPADADDNSTKLNAPDFTLNDINGKPLTLSSLRGKYVVLDFWGSWCVWCVKGMPKMKEYYDKYKGKFEIVGIDCGETEGDWRKAVNDLQIPWLHVYCPEGAPVLDDYGIQGFPTKVVVSPDGKVDKMVIGEDPGFYTYLDQILG